MIEAEGNHVGGGAVQGTSEPVIEMDIVQGPVQARSPYAQGRILHEEGKLATFAHVQFAAVRNYERSIIIGDHLQLDPGGREAHLLLPE